MQRVYNLYSLNITDDMSGGERGWGISGPCIVGTVAIGIHMKCIVNRETAELFCIDSS